MTNAASHTFKQRRLPGEAVGWSTRRNSNARTSNTNTRARVYIASTTAMYVAVPKCDKNALFHLVFWPHMRCESTREEIGGVLS